MKKDNIFKKFAILTVLSLCAFFLFYGLITAKENTERSLKNVNSERIDETELINAIEEKVNDFLLKLK